VLTHQKSRIAVLVGFACFSALALAATSPQFTSATTASGTLNTPFYFQTTVSGEEFASLDSTKSFLLNSATNQPLFCAGEDAWDLIEELSNADVETYLADRASRGFTCIWVALADNTYQANAPQNYYGNVPFDGADFTNEDAAYWAHVDYVVGRAQSYGITFFASPAFVGFNSAEGYLSSLQSASCGALTGYGNFLGARYASYSNIVWTLGGDWDPSILSQSQMECLAAGIRANDPVHLLTAEVCRSCNPSDQSTSSVWTSATAMQLNWVYAPWSDIQASCTSNFATTSAGPSIAGEDWYEGEHSMTPLQVREEGYWEILSGCPVGRIFGNNPIWCFDSPQSQAACNTGTAWQSALSSGGSTSQQYLGALLRSREFWKMIPDISNAVLTGGIGSGATISVASCTSDGQSCIAYDPVGNSQPLQIAMAHFSASVHAWWFNPLTGASTDLGTFANTGTQSFTPPDSNDWALVLDNSSAGLAAPGITTASPGPSPITFAATGLPSGLSINPTTGLITGAPTVGGTFSVNLTATNSAGTGNATLTLTIPGATQTILTWPTPAPIVYGTTISATQEDATANVPGTFAYSQPIGWKPIVGAHTLSVTFKPTDTTDYKSATANVTITVTVATPTITWAAPVAVTWPAALSSRQLDAASKTSGTFAYTPASGTVLSPGSNTLSVTLTPQDTADYTTAAASVPLTVNMATPVVTWTKPASIAYGTALSASQLDASSTTAGSLAYSPSAGTVLTAGAHTLSVTLTPTDSTDYTTTIKTTSLTVTKATPVITWPTPAPISYGTGLSMAQEDATASVQGTFAYTRPLGTKLGAGTHPLSVTFTPADATDYSAVGATVTITISKATPTITWANPAPLVYGISVTAAQEHATASAKGTFAYSQPIGWRPIVGPHSLAVTLTPTDSTDYNKASATVTFTVTPAALTVTASNASRLYGTPNPAFTDTISGFVYGQTKSVITGSASLSTSATTTSPAGAYAIAAALGTLSAANYSFQFVNATLTVNQATPVITWPTPAPITYGTTVSAMQEDATANVAGTFSYSQPIGWRPIVGTHTIAVTFTPTDSTDYKVAKASVTLTVNPAS
jgi:hypothetical protein